DAAVQSFINRTKDIKQLIIVVYGKQTSLQLLDQVICPVVWAPQNSPAVAMHLAQAVFGGVPITAKLSEEVSAHFTKGSGYITPVTRLAYASPADVLEKPI